MPCLDPMDCRQSISPLPCSAEDARAQSAVLSVLLGEYPAQLTTSELSRQLVEDPDDFGQRDAVDRAVRDLAGIGLVHRQGSFVLPSRIALYCERLDLAA
jgi:hypothetical protein